MTHQWSVGKKTLRVGDFVQHWSGWCGVIIGRKNGYPWLRVNGWRQKS